MRREFVLTLVFAIIFLISACTASQSEKTSVVDTAPAAPAAEPTTDSGMETSEETMVESETQSEQQASESEMASGEPEQMEEMEEEMAEEMPAESSDEEAMAIERPAWQLLPLTDARTGERFTLADFEGKTVFVEPMATWCTNCRQQLTNVRNAKSELDNDNVVFVALSVETNIDDATLASYADSAGFDWVFAVLSPDMLKQLADEFGQTIANPPSTPHFIIRADGSTTELVTGIEPAGDIVAQINAAQA